MDCKLTYDYNIAGWHVRLIFQKTDDITNIRLLPSFIPFVISNDSIPDSKNHTPFFTLTIDNDLQAFSDDQVRLIRKFDTGNGDTVVQKITAEGEMTGGYQYVVYDIFGTYCALVQTNADFTVARCALSGGENNQRFGLNNALMLVYAFAGSYHKTMLIHASVVRRGDVAYAFTAKSGTGKSTQVANWLSVIPGCDLLNDDTPIVRVMDDGSVRIYGSPWSGKTPCYRNISARLGAVSLIVRDQKNYLQRLAPLEAFTTYLPACSSMKWEKSIYTRLIDAVTEIVSAVPVCELHCTKEPESAIVCCEELGVFLVKSEEFRDGVV